MIKMAWYDLKASHYILLGIILCWVRPCVAQDERALFDELDHLLSRQKELVAEKERKIKIIKDGLAVPQITPEQSYAINSRLYDEYMAFKYDSAYKYANKNLSIARTLGNRHLYHESVLHLVHILSVAGLFNQAYGWIDSLQEKDLEGDDLLNYYHTCGDLYLFSSEFSEGTDFNKENLEKAQLYREKWRQASVDTLSLGAVSNKADLMAWRGGNRRALDLLENYMRSHKGIEGRDYSILTSTIAFLYGTLGNKPMQKRYLLLSAINDAKNCIRENNSLRELASLLFDEGDINHAYRYLNASIQDANFYGTRLRNAQVAQFVPKVIEEYYQNNKAHRQFLTAFLVVLAVIVVALIVALVFMRRYLYRYRQEKEKVEQANRMLNANVTQMEKTNTLLKVHSAIKEQYIGRFMELVSVVIERTEAQRKLANRLARDHKLPELYSLLKSTEYVSQNTKLFNENFDEAFLNIYSDFVEKVNDLLLPEYRYPVERQSLNTELRILALIRLGITNNQKIASILQSSITTIYTYRSKLKSRSVYKNDFEQKVMEIDG